MIFSIFRKIGVSERQSGNTSLSDEGPSAGDRSGERLHLKRSFPLPTNPKDGERESSAKRGSFECAGFGATGRQRKNFPTAAKSALTSQMAAPIKTRRRIPWFFPLPLASRRDGWSPARQAAFIGFLAQTGSISEAVKAVGMGRQGAYRLRRRPWAASFATAWDAALGLPVDGPAAWYAVGGNARKPKATSEELAWRYETGLWRPVLRNRRFVRVARKPCNTTLLQMLARMDQACRNFREEDLYANA